MKKTILMVTLLLCAVFLGTLIGEASANSEGFAWLARSFDVGVSPFDLDLKVIVLTFGCEFRICVAQVFMILIALIAYPKLAAAISA